MYADFILKANSRDIKREDIIDMDTNKPIGQIRLFNRDGIISVRFRSKEVASIDREETYKENGNKIKIQRYDSDVLTSEKYDGLREMGLDHAYSLGKKSNIAYVYCFEREENLAGVVIGRDDESEEAPFKGLALTLAKRIENQDFINEFLG